MACYFRKNYDEITILGTVLNYTSSGIFVLWLKRNGRQYIWQQTYLNHNAGGGAVVPLGWLLDYVLVKRTTYKQSQMIYRWYLSKVNEPLWKSYHFGTIYSWQKCHLFINLLIAWLLFQVSAEGLCSIILDKYWPGDGLCSHLGWEWRRYGPHGRTDVWYEMTFQDCTQNPWWSWKLRPLH